VRSFTWVKEHGAEYAELTVGHGELRISGVAVDADPLPCRLDYELDCGPDRYVTRRLSVHVRGACWARHLVLERDPRGEWLIQASADGEPGPPGLPAPGGDAAALSGALDCDLGECPVTNTMPVLREGLLSGGSAELTAAFVSVPDLAVRPARQRYTYLSSGTDGSSVIRYQSGAFTADVTFSPEGLVTSYPRLGRLA